MLDHFKNGELTVISFSTDVPEKPERRRSDRSLSVLRAALLRTVHGDELCLVRNISAGGLMAHVYSTLRPGDPVTIEFKSENSVRGQVVWVDERLVGIQFMQPADIAEILSDRCDPARGQARAPRVQIHRPARIRSGARYQSIVLCDISQAGVKLCLSKPELLGEEVVLMAQGLPAIAGVVRWRRGDYAGIAFNHLVSFPEIARWVVDEHRGADAGNGALIGTLPDPALE
jgi:hypothetical protein